MLLRTYHTAITAWLEQQGRPVVAQVVGEKEAAEGTVNVRTRDNVVHGMHALEDVKQLGLGGKPSPGFIIRNHGARHLKADWHDKGCS